jgi:CRISPR-associated protein Cmr5
MSQTLAQRRAADALKKIQEVEKAREQGKAAYAKYDSYISGLPATITMSGLGQAAATLLASAKLGKEKRNDDNRTYELLYNHLSSWLCGGHDESPYQEGDLLDNITSNEENAYLHAQAEAMAYLEWLKKFSDAYLKKD